MLHPSHGALFSIWTIRLATGRSERRPYQAGGYHGVLDRVTCAIAFLGHDVPLMDHERPIPSHVAPLTGDRPPVRPCRRVVLASVLPDAEHRWRGRLGAGAAVRVGDRISTCGFPRRW